MPFFTTSGIIEEKGKYEFIPAHPTPLKENPNVFAIIMGSRRNLIGNWHESAYQSGVDCFKILGRQVVVANSPESIKYVLVTRHSNFDRKSPQMRRALHMLLGDGLFISDGNTWQSRRPLVADIVHRKRMPEFMPTMESVIEDFARGWQANEDLINVDLTTEMASLTAEIISQTVFGRNLGRDTAQKVIEGFSSYQDKIDSFNLGYWLGFDEGWPVLKTRQLRKAVDNVHQVIDSVIEAHLAGLGDHGSMLDLLVERNRRSPELALDLEALRNEAATIFMAGHETTATTLTWAFYCIANAPWVERAVLEEINNVCGTRPPRLADLRNLRWCRAVVSETLRLYPPVPLLPRQARGQDRVGNFDVAKGSLVLIAPWLLHRARDLWDRPNSFLPERFMDGSKIDPFSYIPFSVGPRICAGLNFGFEESVLCLSSLIQRFRIVPNPNYRVSPVCRLTLRPDGGLPVWIEPRKHAPH